MMTNWMARVVESMSVEVDGSNWYRVSIAIQGVILSPRKRV